MLSACSEILDPSSTVFFENKEATFSQALLHMVALMPTVAQNLANIKNNLEPAKEDFDHIPIEKIPDSNCPLVKMMGQSMGELAVRKLHEDHLESERAEASQRCMRRLERSANTQPLFATIQAFSVHTQNAFDPIILVSQTTSFEDRDILLAVVKFLKHRDASQAFIDGLEPTTILEPVARAFSKVLLPLKEAIALISRSCPIDMPKTKEALCEASAFFKPIDSFIVSCIPQQDGPEPKIPLKTPCKSSLAVATA